MLILERGYREGLCIGEDIRIQVLKTGVNRVTLGVTAPPEVPVWREEIAARRPASTKPSAAARASSLRVLIIEDDPIHAKLISTSLAIHGTNRVSTANCGEAALSFMDRVDAGEIDRPDLVLLDYALPGMSGLEILRNIRQRPSGRLLPVVMFSASSDDSVVMGCIAAGANAFIAKAEHYEEFKQSIFKIADFWGFARQVA